MSDLLIPAIGIVLAIIISISGWIDDRKGRKQRAEMIKAGHLPLKKKYYACCR